MKTGIELITEEREEQLSKHGYSIEGDLEHESEELRLVAVRALTIKDDTRSLGHYTARNFNCDWADAEDHICKKSYKDRLIVAGALIAAEIDRIQVKEKANEEELVKIAKELNYDKISF